MTKKFSELPTASGLLSGAELLPLVQGGTTKRSTIAQLPFYRNSIDIPPASPNAWDDEFNATTLDSAWTFINQTSGGATCHATLDGQQLSLTDDAQIPAGFGRLLVKPKPSGNFNIVAKVKFDSYAGYNNCGIALYNSADGSYVINRLVNRTPSQYSLTPGWLAGSDLLTMAGSEGNISVIPPECYLRMSRTSANTVYLAVSLFGKIWITVLSDTVLDVSYDNIGMYYCNFDATSGYISVATFEWIRNLV